LLKFKQLQVDYHKSDSS